MAEWIVEAETLVDLLEGTWKGGTQIFRCKDCIHSEHWYGDKARCFLWNEKGIDVFENGFCNYAERRTE